MQKEHSVRVQGRDDTEAALTNTMQTTEEIKIVPVNGTEYASVRTLSKMFDVDKKSVLAKLKELQEAYSISVLRWGDNTLLVHLAQFRTALFRSSKPFQS